MAVQQVAGYVQNDGNFCQLDLKDRDFDGPLMRIETFRCSQPTGKFGVTGAGTHVKYLAGLDHLTPTSNRTFRHIFSVQDKNKTKVTLEIRGVYDESGSWEIRVRDLDPESDSFGRVLIAKVKPKGEAAYHLRYEIRQQPNVKRTLVSSPLSARIMEIVSELSDIGAPLEKLGAIDPNFAANPLDGELHWGSDYYEVNTFFDDFVDNFQQKHFSTWARNFQVYTRFGDFRDKCIHPGTNLVGPNRQLASEYLIIRAYRDSLILGGRVFDPEMAKGGFFNVWESEDPLSIDPKPGVYAPFLSAYILDIGMYQLGIDKVHSDYGGIPMALAPGSKLETGISPIVDSTRANQVLAELAVLFYQPQLSQLFGVTGMARELQEV